VLTPAASLRVTHSESQSACHTQHTHMHTPPDCSRLGCGHTSVRREREKDRKQKIREISQRSLNYFLQFLWGKTVKMSGSYLCHNVLCLVRVSMHLTHCSK